MRYPKMSKKIFVFNNTLPLNAKNITDKLRDNKLLL